MCSHIIVQSRKLGSTALCGLPFENLSNLNIHVSTIDQVCQCYLESTRTTGWEKQKESVNERSLVAFHSTRIFEKSSVFNLQQEIFSLFPVYLYDNSSHLADRGALHWKYPSFVRLVNFSASFLLCETVHECCVSMQGGSELTEAFVDFLYLDKWSVGNGERKGEQNKPPHDKPGL